VELNTQWEQASGDMNDIFAVTRQGASDAVKLLSESAVEGQYPDRLAPLKTMAQDKQVPDRAALALLPATLLQEIRESGRVAQFNGKVLDAQGVASEQTLTGSAASPCWAMLVSCNRGPKAWSGAGPARQRAFRCGRLSGSGGRSVAAGSLPRCSARYAGPGAHLLAASPAGRPSAPSSCCWPPSAWGSLEYGCGASLANWVGSFVASSRAVNIMPTTPSAGC
jgi:hypothetical protein